VMENARKLGERNWRNAARNRDSWQKFLKKAWPKRGCCANDEDDMFSAHLQLTVVCILRNSNTVSMSECMCVLLSPYNSRTVYVNT